MFFILKGKILKQASYVNVKVIKTGHSFTIISCRDHFVTQSTTKKPSLNRLTDSTHTVPEATGHELRRPSLRPMNAEPEPLFHPRVDCGASPLQVGQLQSHDTYKAKEKMLKGSYLTSGLSHSPAVNLCHIMELSKKKKKKKS